MESRVLIPRSDKSSTLKEPRKPLQHKRQQNVAKLISIQSELPRTRSCEVIYAMLDFKLSIGWKYKKAASDYCDYVATSN